MRQNIVDAVSAIDGTSILVALALVVIAYLCNVLYDIYKKDDE
ncbi:TMhelix containing protein [Vibrio phage 1.081.O._10N.286.52.C2]|nr:TMhelix containing protein [Vibrio phage 1.081.O._10N.286.52.C2]